MPDTKWTPGPWTTRKTEDRETQVLSEAWGEDQYWVIAETCNHVEGDETGETMNANAKLIAKAPEMYELLKKVSGDGYRRTGRMAEIESLLKELDNDSG